VNPSSAVLGTYTYATRPPLSESTSRRLRSTQARLRSAASLASGTTDTVRAPAPSARGPTVMSVSRSAVFSNAACRLAGARSSRPFTASRYSPGRTFTPGSVSGARRSGVQLRPPYTARKRYRPSATS
jgi:hypothetical protein